MSNVEKKSKFPPIEIRALRRKEEGTFERLLCQLLIQANSSEGLPKIEKMCQAFYRAKPMLPHNPVEIKEDTVEVIYTVARALNHVIFCNLSDSSEGSFCKIMWSFDLNSDNYKRFIEPWRQAKVDVTYYPYIGGGYEAVVREEIARIEKQLKSLNNTEYFFCITMGRLGSGGLLTKSSCQHLTNQFVVWAMPQVDEWFMELSKLVDQSVFDSVLKTMYGAKEREKELEE
jgi:hypothetical protein